MGERRGGEAIEQLAGEAGLEPLSPCGLCEACTAGIPSMRRGAFISTPWLRIKGEACLCSIVNTLKPRIGQSLRTLAEPEHTASMGSLRGGLAGFLPSFVIPVSSERQAFLLVCEGSGLPRNYAARALHGHGPAASKRASEPMRSSISSTRGVCSVCSVKAWWKRKTTARRKMPWVFTASRPGPEGCRLCYVSSSVKRGSETLKRVSPGLEAT